MSETGPVDNITSTESAAEVIPINIEQEHTDTEILGRSFAVRRSIEAARNSAIETRDAMYAGIRNMFDRPGQLKTFILHRSAEKKFNKKQNKYEAVKNKESRLANRRKKAMDKAEKRLAYHTEQKDSRAKRMNDRLSSVQNDYENRVEATRSKYVERKQAAVARKALRDQLKEEGAGVRERRMLVKEILTDMSSEDIQKLGRSAVSAGLSKESLGKAEKLDKRQGDAKEKALGEVRRTREKVVNLEAVSSANLKRVEKLEGRLPSYQSNVEKASATLEALESDDSTDTLDVIFARNDLRAAEAKVAMIEKEIEALRHEALAAAKKANALNEYAQRQVDRASSADAAQKQNLRNLEARQEQHQRHNAIYEAGMKKALNNPEGNMDSKKVEGDQDASTEQAAA